MRTMIVVLVLCLCGVGNASHVCGPGEPCPTVVAQSDNATPKAEVVKAESAPKYEYDKEGCRFKGECTCGSRLGSVHTDCCATWKVCDGPGAKKNPDGSVTWIPVD